MEEYAFERLCERHRNAVIDIFNHYVRETTAAYRDAEVGYEFFDNFLEDAASYPAYAVVGPGGEVAGFCMLEPLMPIPTFAETAEVTYFLRADQTGKGLGALALARLEEDARRLGVRKLVANLSSGNLGSLVFHIRNGFEEYGRLRDAGRKFGLPFDIVYLEKSLA